MSDSAPVLVSLLINASRALARAVEERTRDRELTSTQWRLLVMLRKHGPLRQARLAEVLDIEPISVSRLVDRMAQAGWVERAADPEDRRARVVHPTARGTASLARLGDVAEDACGVALAGFTVAEREALVAMLARLNDNLAQGGAPAADPPRAPQRTDP